MPGASGIAGAALALAGLAGTDAAVYRHKDAQGIAVFTDRPGTGRQEVTLAAVNTYTTTSMPSKQPASMPAEADASPTYRSLMVTGPRHGETIRRNGGNLRVTGRIEPRLRGHHNAVLFMDGAPVAFGHAARAGTQAGQHGDIEFPLTGVARGPHTLRIAIMDQQNRVLAESVPVGFHLLRAAAGRRPSPRP